MFCTLTHHIFNSAATVNTATGTVKPSEYTNLTQIHTFHITKLLDLMKNMLLSTKYIIDYFMIQFENLELRLLTIINDTTNNNSSSSSKSSKNNTNANTDTINDYTLFLDGVGGLTEPSLKLLETYKQLNEKIESCHISHLVPLLLFGFNLVWNHFIVNRKRNYTEIFAQLFPLLCELDYSLSRMKAMDQKYQWLLLRSYTQPTTTIQDNNNNHNLKDIASYDPAKFTTTGTDASNTNTSSSVNIIQIPIQPVLQWDVGMSNNNLEYTEDNTSCRRPGSNSCYPAAFAPVPGVRSSFTVTLAEALSTTNWLTIGICAAGFATQSSDGFGRTVSSW